jgi:hypothetical protein
METTASIEFPPAAAGPATAPGQPDSGFHDILSALNPLQYVPVVGNIVRALTGDAPPEPVRIAGSLAFSALTGGPLGVALYAAVTAAEKLTGFDPDQFAHTALASLGLTGDAAPVQAAAAYARAMQIGHG